MNYALMTLIFEITIISDQINQEYYKEVVDKDKSNALYLKRAELQQGIELIKEYLK